MNRIRRALPTEIRLILAAGAATTTAALAIGIPIWVITLAAVIPASTIAVPLWLVHRHASHVRRAIRQRSAPGRAPIPLAPRGPRPIATPYRTAA